MKNIAIAILLIIIVSSCSKEIESNSNLSNSKKLDVVTISDSSSRDSFITYIDKSSKIIIYDPTCSTVRLLTFYDTTYVGVLLGGDIMWKCKYEKTDSVLKINYVSIRLPELNFRYLHQDTLLYLKDNTKWIKEQ